MTVTAVAAESGAPNQLASPCRHMLLRAPRSLAWPTHPAGCFAEAAHAESQSGQSKAQSVAKHPLLGLAAKAHDAWVAAGSRLQLHLAINTFKKGRGRHAPRKSDIDVFCALSA